MIEHYTSESESEGKSSDGYGDSDMVPDDFDTFDLPANRARQEQHGARQEAGQDVSDEEYGDGHSEDVGRYESNDEEYDDVGSEEESISGRLEHQLGEGEGVRRPGGMKIADMADLY